MTAVDCPDQQGADVPEFEDARLYAALREYVLAAEALQDVAPQDEPRRTLELAEHKSLAGMALRRRLMEMGWAPPARRSVETPKPSSGQAPIPTADRDIDVQP